MKVIRIFGYFYLSGSLALATENLSSRIISYAFSDRWSEKSGICTGLFLDGQTILTAAHCQKYIPLKGDKRLRVSTEDVFDSGKNIIPHYSLHPHPEYDSKTHLNDLMVIKIVKEQFTFTNTDIYQLISNDNLEGEFFSTGFGYTRGGTSSQAKYHLKHNVPLSLCLKKGAATQDRDKKKLWRARLHFNHLGKKWREKTQVGDSGGPNFIKHLNGEREVVAIVTGLFINKIDPEKSSPCTSQTVAIHTWLYPHLDWIRSFQKEIQ